MKNKNEVLFQKFKLGEIIQKSNKYKQLGLRRIILLSQIQDKKVLAKIQQYLLFLKVQNNKTDQWWLLQNLYQKSQDWAESGEVDKKVQIGDIRPQVGCDEPCPSCRYLMMPSSPSETENIGKFDDTSRHHRNKPSRFADGAYELMEPSSRTSQHHL